MSYWVIEIKRKSDGKLVYGNSGGDDMKAMFDNDVAQYDPVDFDILYEDKQAEKDAEKAAKEADKDLLKDTNANTKDRLDALIRHLGLDI
jgi:hypothetical protein